MSTERRPGKSILIREAGPADLPIVLEFRMGMMADVFKAEMGAPGDAVSLREANARWLAEHMGRDFAAWLAEVGGRPAGSAAVLWFPHPPGPRNPVGLEAYVLNVYTKPEFRRLGVARALTTRVVEVARARGVNRIWLRASSEGRPLYEDIGFGARNYLELALEPPDR
jgi:GNAT superfamily N-acetyltransferase